MPATSGATLVAEPQPGEVTGALNRAIRIAVRERSARAILHDDFHHFRVAIEHDGQAVTAIATDARRQPYTLCDAAGKSLNALLGFKLTSSPLAVLQDVDSALQCTHQLDLAALTIAAATRGAPRIYDARVGDAVNGTSTATLQRDGAAVLAWTVRDYAIVAPAPFARLSLGAGFSAWVASHLAGDSAEAALVLRRAVFVSRGRGMLESLDRLGHAPATGNCWVQQPERAMEARRPQNCVRDYSSGGVPFDEEDRRWLSGQ